MKEALLRATNNCALRYAKGHPRWVHLWDEMLTVNQKVEQIVDELTAMGYVLVTPVDSATVFNDNSEGE